MVLPRAGLAPPYRPGRPPPGPVSTVWGMSSLQTTLLILGASGDLSKRLLLPGLATLLEVKEDWDVQLVGAGVEDISDADWKQLVRDVVRERTGVEERGGRGRLGGDVAVRTRLQAVVDASTYRKADVTGPTTCGHCSPTATTTPRSTSHCRPRSPRRAASSLAHLDLPAGTRLALEKPFGTDADERRAPQRPAALVPARGAHPPRRPLPRPLHRAQPARAALREPHHRAAAVVAARRARRHRLRRDPRARGPRALLRQGRRPRRHDPEPPAAGDGRRRDGGPRVDRRRRPAHPEGARAAGRPAVGRRPAHRRQARPVHRRHGRGPPAAVVRRRGRRRPVARHRDPRAAHSSRSRTGAGPACPSPCGPARRSARSAARSSSRSRTPRTCPTGSPACSVPDRLRIWIAPDKMELELNVNGPGDPYTIDHTVLETTFNPGRLSAYGEVLAGVLEGDATLSVRGDSAVQGWKVVEPVPRPRGRPARRRSTTTPPGPRGPRAGTTSTAERCRGDRGVVLRRRTGRRA